MSCEVIRLMQDIAKTQHYTTNYDIICGNLIQYIPQDAILVEPFVGQGDLLNLFPEHQWELYDLEPKIDGCTTQDTLLNIPDYNNKYVITNPPYLAKNKAQDRSIYEQYELDDLYKIALKTMLAASGGILIIPTNFFCDNYSQKIREEFLDTFDILAVNVFTEPIFDDTTYSVCAFAFKRKVRVNNVQSFNITKYPSLETYTIIIEKEFGYRIGGQVFHFLSGIKPSFTRLLKDKEPTGYITKINLYTIDTRTEPLHLTFGEPSFYGKSTDRTYATLVSNIELSEEIQQALVEKCNDFLTTYRLENGNLVFTNYRDYDRKRVEFDFVYRLLTYLLENI